MSAKCQKRTFMDVPNLCLFDPTVSSNIWVSLGRTRFELSVGQQAMMGVSKEKDADQHRPASFVCYCARGDGHARGKGTPRGMWESSAPF